MQRTRVNTLTKIVVVFTCVSFTLWYFSQSHRVPPRQVVDDLWSQDLEESLPSGIDSYIKELRSLPENNVNIQKETSKRPRILCLILTKADNLNTKVAVVNSTWISRCHKHFFVLNTTRTGFDIINTPYAEHRENLVHKVRYAFKHIYTSHIDDFDWILKADDDTYFIMENLQFLLSHYVSAQPGYLGFHFAKMAAENGFMSGGAGYVISNRALRRLIEFGFQRDACPIVTQEGDPDNSEDIEIGRCLNVSGVEVLSSLDSTGRETFHPYPLQQYIISNHLPSYLYDRAMNLPKLGLECCSEYSISFHYMSNEAMLVMDHLLYRTSVFGRNGLQASAADKKAVFKIETVNVDEKRSERRNSRPGLRKRLRVHS